MCALCVYARWRTKAQGTTNAVCRVLPWLEGQWLDPWNPSPQLVLEEQSWGRGRVTIAVTWFATEATQIFRDIKFPFRVLLRVQFWSWRAKEEGRRGQRDGEAWPHSLICCLHSSFLSSHCRSGSITKGEVTYFHPTSKLIADGAQKEGNGGPGLFPPPPSDHSLFSVSQLRDEEPLLPGCTRSPVSLSWVGTRDAL